MLRTNTRGGGGILIVWVLVGAACAGANATESVPAVLATPAGRILAGRYSAVGKQIYDCVPRGGALAWVLKAPEAALTGVGGESLIRHFAGPTWQAADGSKLVGTLLAKAPATEAGAIPWLLLRATVSGTGILTGIHFVQRLYTKGGVAPSGGCTSGAELRVPYTATYTFWR